MTDIDTNAAKVCRCCGAVLQGKFCHECGQKHLLGRLTVSELVSNAFAALTELDSTLWRTLRELALNPGQVALNYISGQRALYINPVKLFLTVFAVYMALLAATGTLEQIANDAVHISEGTDMSSRPVQAALALQQILRQHFNLILFLTVPLLAFALRWQYWRAGRNYAETFSFTCYILALSSLYGAVFLIILYFFDTYSNAPRALALYGLFLQGARAFFDMSWIRTLLASLVSVFLYLICTMMAGFSLTLLKLFGWL